MNRIRALGGAELQGERLVRLVYVDEAGISKPEEEPWTVVSFVVVDADKKLIQVERALDKIVEKHIPEHLQDGFVFHALELFNGGGKVFKRQKDDLVGPPQWPLRRRLAIAREIALIPVALRLPIAFGFLEKAQFPQTFEVPEEWTPSERLAFQHVCAFMPGAMLVEQWMRAHAQTECCLMIVEDNANCPEADSRYAVSASEQKHRKDLERRRQKAFPVSEDQRNAAVSRQAPVKRLATRRLRGIRLQAFPHEPEASTLRAFLRPVPGADDLGEAGTITPTAALNALPLSSTPSSRAVASNRFDWSGSVCSSLFFRRTLPPLSPRLFFNEPFDR